MITSAAERLLRGEAAEAPTTATCALVGAAGAAAMGLALGGSSGDVRLGLFAAVKVPLLLVLATGLCLPSFYVVNSVLGLRDDFAAAWHALIASQATLGIVLGALAPVAVFQSLSVHDPYAQTLLDAGLFATATWAAQQVLARHYRPLIARDPRHRHAVRLWLVLYAFAGIQLAWNLRPFRGTEGFAVQFLRPEAFDQNAYVVMLEHLTRLLR
jgi:hypothetical protein